MICSWNSAVAPLFWPTASGATQSWLAIDTRCIGKKSPEKKWSMTIALNAGLTNWRMVFADNERWSEGNCGPRGTTFINKALVRGGLFLKLKVRVSDSRELHGDNNPRNVNNKQERLDLDLIILIMTGTTCSPHTHPIPTNFSPSPPHPHHTRPHPHPIFVHFPP